MTKTTFLPLAAALLLSATAHAQTALTPADARISDQAIHADNEAYTVLQNRIHQLNERGVPVRDYYLSKAQCWLDVSLHEYTRNDRSAFPQEAMTESEKLIVGLEQKTQNLSMETPLVNSAEHLRPDLWLQLDALKQHAGFKCAWQQVACAEVELVHSGNEFNQQQWRHAKPYVQIAEELTSEATSLVEQCIPAPKVMAVTVPAVPVAAPVVVTERVNLTARVLFDFDEFTPEHIRTTSRGELDALIARVKLEGIHIDTLALTGHADRLNGTGNKNYNQALSQKRVNTVRDLLAAQGLTVSSVAIDAKGDTDQVKACQAQFKKTSELEECLLPNRRVQVELTGVKKTTTP